VLAELLNQGVGLFSSKDGGRTLQPNPHSELTAGDDHLVHFALLGRITGIALAHKEPLNAAWSHAFLKAAFGYKIETDDLQSVDPELYARKVEYLRKASVEELAALDQVFEYEADHDDEYAGERPPPHPLKEGGSEEVVSKDNLEEYLQLWVEHRIVGAIRKQTEHFRAGLGVILNDEVREKFCKSCTVAELQMIVCGTDSIDIEDWQANTVYRGGFSATSPTVEWFWSIIKGLDQQERAAVLTFSTGSPRVPAAGFANLMGYNGTLAQFTLELADSGIDGSTRLPTAATCFNKLRLCKFDSEGSLRRMLLMAVHYGTGAGFDEGAVAT
jgi:E3 ubiquitin-protein ligase HACE1